MRFLLLLAIMLAASAYSQSVIGQWKTIDDKTNEQRSVIEIFERGGKVYGKVIKLFRKPGEDPDPICDLCDEDDPRHKKKVIGMEIMKDMEKDGDEYSGNVLDPENGKIYRGKIW